MDVQRFRQLPLLGILRGISAADVGPLTEALCLAELQTIEITMNTAGASSLIAQMVTQAAGRLTIGAGTVLSCDDMDRALDAGASFIVMPVLVPEVVAACRSRGVPVFPGALTPQEIFNAWRAGATMVKVFPANCFGPTYLKDIRGPFSDIELLAVGGINPTNIPTFFACGASAVAFGASVFRPAWLAERRYDLIQQEVRALVEACRASRDFESTST